MHLGLCMEKLDWAASLPEASGGDVAFCAHSFCANLVSLVIVVMSVFVSPPLDEHGLTRDLVCAVIARPQSACRPPATDGACDRPRRFAGAVRRTGKPAGYARETGAEDASGSATASLRSLLSLVAIAREKRANEYVLRV
ncbi:hypothetical protein [Burkholderia pseudomallei]|uniref:hypothetical protein n=1 Tax=Burkholderia pseudomallei TaxID=28450 RepID=UPI0024687D6C|nr:hypothetical protein [Burkholderia pseudomallei]